MTHLFLTFCSITFMLHITSTQWQGPMLPILPIADSYSAVGAYNDTIYILGGDMHDTNLLSVTYNIISGEFMDIESHPLRSAVYGYAQFYTQQDDTLYFIVSPTATIARYNLKTETYDGTFSQIISTKPHYDGCLASSTRYLVLLGGDTDVNIVLLLDLTTNNWITNTKNLSTSRRGAACAIDPQTETIYVIGGQQNVSSKSPQKWFAKNTIEINYIHSVTEREWSRIDNLPVAITRARCVLHDVYIYVIGGVNRQGVPVDIVQMIHTQTGKTSVSPYKLPWNVAGCAAVIVGDIIYAFGGESGSYFDTLNIWMYSDLNEPKDNTNAQKTTSDHLGIGILIGMIISFAIVANIAIFWYVRKKIKQRHASLWDSQLLESNNSNSTSAYSADSVWKLGSN